MRGWLARIEGLVIDGLSDAFEQAHVAIESRLKTLLGAGSEITEGLDALLSTVRAFNGRISACQSTLHELCGKYPEVVSLVEVSAGKNVRGVVKGCFELFQKKVDTIIDMVERAQSMLMGTSELDDSMVESLKTSALGLFELALPLQVNDAQTVSTSSLANAAVCFTLNHLARTLHTI